VLEFPSGVLRASVGYATLKNIGLLGDFGLKLVPFVGHVDAALWARQSNGPDERQRFVKAPMDLA
jgi:hypothetical protein